MIKNFSKNIILKILTWEAKMVLANYKPYSIGITGSVGKTSTKEAVVAALASHYFVRGSAKSYNSEFGVPLTILDLETAWESPWGWLVNLWRGLWLILFPGKYPQYLVLEIGADKPGDIANLVKWLPIKIAIITRVPDIPVHIEFFASPSEVVKEKMNLAKAVPADGLVIINSDDKNIYPPEVRLKAPVITYGLGDLARVKGSDVAKWFDREKTLPTLLGLTFKINYQGSSIPLRIRGTLGHHHVYTYLAASAVATTQGLNIIDVAKALEDHLTPPGRLRLLPGVKESLILDDSYNSSPAALEAALQSLKEIETEGEKIAILGDMLELGSYTEEAHYQAGLFLASFVDHLLVVGTRAKFIAQGAQEAGLTKEKIQYFTDSTKAGKVAELLIKPGSIVLIKGSQGMRLEKATEEVMAEPERKKELLPRQDLAWEKR